MNEPLSGARNAGKTRWPPSRAAATRSTSAGVQFVERHFGQSVDYSAKAYSGGYYADK